MRLCELHSTIYLQVGSAGVAGTVCAGGGLLALLHAASTFAAWRTSVIQRCGFESKWCAWPLSTAL